MTRASWKRYWRGIRITRRENAKAVEDMMIFGTGYACWGDFGAAQRDGSDVMRRISPEDIYISRPETA